MLTAGWLVLTLGIVGGGVVAFLGFWGFFSGLTGIPKAQVGQTLEYQASGEGTGLLFTDSPFSLGCSIEDPQGDAVSIRPLGGTSYSGSGMDAFGKFDTSEGIYLIDCDVRTFTNENFSPGPSASFGASEIDNSKLGLAIGSILAGILVSLMGVGFLIAGFVRRSRHRTQLRTAQIANSRPSTLGQAGNTPPPPQTPAVRSERGAGDQPPPPPPPPESGPLIE